MGVATPAASSLSTALSVTEKRRGATPESVPTNPGQLADSNTSSSPRTYLTWTLRRESASRSVCQSRFRACSGPGTRASAARSPDGAVSGRPGGKQV
jgi:hypothetical protein